MACKNTQRIRQKKAIRLETESDGGNPSRTPEFHALVHRFLSREPPGFFVSATAQCVKHAEAAIVIHLQRLVFRLRVSVWKLGVGVRIRVEATIRKLIRLTPGVFDDWRSLRSLMRPTKFSSQWRPHQGVGRTKER